VRRNNKELVDTLDFYRNWIKESAKGNEWVYFPSYDYFWKTEMFSDPLHLNDRGANKLSSVLAKMYKKLSND